MNSCALTDKGNVRRQNQDCYFLSCLPEKDAAVMVVCDGMGGAKAGNVASDLACKVFAEAFGSGFDPSDPSLDVEKRLVDTLALANTAVYELSVADEACRGMGTTLVAAVAIRGALTVINVGDSRAYHITDDAMIRITRDHSVVEDMVEEGRISRAESRTHPSKNLITRAVGTGPEVACDVFKRRIEPGEKLLLCSDGLSNLSDDRDLFAFIKARPDIRTCAEALMTDAADKGAPDNVTLILFEA